MKTIFYSKFEDEYLLRFPPIHGIGSHEFSVPVSEENTEVLEDYLREQCQDEIDNGDFSEDTAEILQECLDNGCFEEEKVFSPEESWLLAWQQIEAERQRIEENARKPGHFFDFFKM